MLKHLHSRIQIWTRFYKYLVRMSSIYCNSQHIHSTRSSTSEVPFHINKYNQNVNCTWILKKADTHTQPSQQTVIVYSVRMVAMFTKKMAVLNMTQSVAPLRHDRKQQNEHARPQIPVLGALGAWSFNEASFLYVCWSDVGHHGHRSQGSSRWKTEPPTHWVLVQVSDLFQHDLLDSSQGSHGSRSLKALPVWSSVLIDFVWIHAVWSPGSGNVCAGNTTDLRPKEPPKTMEVWFRLRFLQEMSRRLFPWSDPTSHAETLVQRTAWPGGVLLGWEAYECQVKIFEKLVTHS